MQDSAILNNKRLQLTLSNLDTFNKGIEGLAYDNQGLIPVVVQDEQTGMVLMVAWANKEAIKKTLTTGTSWFWSRSRKELWNKGATSSNIQHVSQVLVDCDADSLLYLVSPAGPACHTGALSCFFRELKK